MGSEQNKTFTRIVAGNHVSWKDGGFFVFKVPGMNLPLYTYIGLIESLRSMGKKGEQEIYLNFEKEMIIAVDYMKSKFGIKNPVELMNSCLQQIPLLGFGNFKHIRINFEKAQFLFKNTQSHFAKYHKFMHGKAKETVDSFLAGFLAGTLEAITERPLVCVETQCIARGDPSCVFEVKAVEEFSREEQEQHFSKQLPLATLREMCKKEKEIISAPR